MLVINIFKYYLDLFIKNEIINYYKHYLILFLKNV